MNLDIHGYFSFLLDFSFLPSHIDAFAFISIRREKLIVHPTKQNLIKLFVLPCNPVETSLVA